MKEHIKLDDLSSTITGHVRANYTLTTLETLKFLFAIICAATIILLNYDDTKITLKWQSTMAFSPDFSQTKQGFGKKPGELFLSSNKLKHIAKKVGQIQAINKLLDKYIDINLRSHCFVCAVQNGHLVIFVDSPHWSLQLRSQIPYLLSKLRDEGKQHGLVSIKCKTNPSPIATAPEIKQGPGIEKLSSQSAAYIEDAAKHIKNERLKESLNRLSKNTK